MRFRKIRELLGGTKEVLPEEEQRFRKPRAPRVARTGEVVTEQRWQQEIFTIEWEPFQRRKLNLLWHLYPTPVTSDDLRVEFQQIGPWTLGDFRTINEKFRDLRAPYRVEGERDGFQVFHVASIH